MRRRLLLLLAVVAVLVALAAAGAAAYQHVAGTGGVYAGHTGMGPDGWNDGCCGTG